MKTDRPLTRFLLCPRCGRKTRTLVREDTELDPFPVILPEMQIRVRDHIQKRND